MLRKIEISALLVTDFIFLNLSYVVYYLARFRWNLLPTGPEPPSIFVPMLILSVLWVLLFVMSSLYSERFAPSRLDELIVILRTVTIGSLTLFFLAFADVLEAGAARRNLFYYWAIVLGLVSFGRVFIRSIQKYLLQRGYGARKALIVGWSEAVQDLYEEVAKHPQAGLKIVGAIQMRGNTVTEAAMATSPVALVDDGSEGTATVAEVSTIDNPLQTHGFENEELRSMQSLPHLIDELGVADVLIVLGEQDESNLPNVLQLCDGKGVTLKLVPTYHQILSGMARTEQIYGLPLIEVKSEPMKLWERFAKRILDAFVSFLVVVIGLPIWLFIGAFIKVVSPGPAIFRQERVGKDGKLFTMLKFRTMKVDAEKETGPVWASANDPRYTNIGRWLRKTRIDEIPQFWNVLKGEMSLVGPRPERPFFVKKLSKQIPLYSRRLRVKPGITGIAQVNWKYDESIEDVRQKVKYDLFYTSNMSIPLDLKILIATIRTALGGSGQ